MKVTRFGHAALVVEVADKRILIDPGTFSIPATFELTNLDAIIVTHQHPDHVDVTRIPGLIALNPEAVLLAEPGAKAELDDLGSSWIATAADATTTVGSVDIIGVGAEHAVIHHDMPPVGNVGVLITAPHSPTLFHPGDSYASVPDGVHALAVPLSAPWAKVSETVDFVRAVSPAVAFPIHDCTIAELAYGIYWSRIVELGGAGDTVLLAQDGVLQLDSSPA